MILGTVKLLTAVPSSSSKLIAVILQKQQVQNFSISRKLKMEKKYFLLTYQYVSDVLEKRGPLREEHFTLAQRYSSEGKMLLGGAFCDPLDGAAVVFHVENKAEIEDFVKNDPYVRHGIVSDWKIREWTVLVGSKYETFLDK